MNSPDTDSPMNSTPSTASPPNEEVGANYASSTSTGNLLDRVASSLISPASKRRLPGHASAAAGSARDTKSRRREEPKRSGTVVWETKDSRKDKEDLVDTNIVEYLRREVGDPFLEISG